ncbi:hypothetical protein D9M68_797010 [compost metagenome]
MLAWITKDSLKRLCSIGLRPLRIWMNDDCDSAASSLRVEWVANTVGASAWCSAGSPRMAKRRRYSGLKRA